jgi:hypothetical protein
MPYLDTHTAIGVHIRGKCSLEVTLSSKELWCHPPYRSAAFRGMRASGTFRDATKSKIGEARMVIVVDENV